MEEIEDEWMNIMRFYNGIEKVNIGRGEEI